MPSPVDRYYREVKKENPSYDDQKAWATAWSIYCKHKNPGSDHCHKPSSEYLKGKKAMDPLREFQDALIVRNVVARVMAMDFDTPEALEKYLKDHPKADKGKHKVKNDNAETREDFINRKDEEHAGGKPHFNDEKTYEKATKRVVKMEEATKGVYRLRDQVRRLESYRHSDPAKAKEVTKKLTDKAEAIAEQGEEHLKEAEKHIKAYMEHYGFDNEVAKENEKWFSGAYAKAEKALKQVKEKSKDLSAKAESGSRFLGIDADYLVNQVEELHAMSKLLSGIMYTTSGKMRGAR